LNRNLTAIHFRKVKQEHIFFQEKIGWHSSVAAPGDTNPSDATE